MQQNRLIEDSLALAAGAAAGVALMYLFDPQSGEERRHHVAKRAGNAFAGAGGAAAGAGSALGSAIGIVGGKARHLTGHLADRASEWAHTAGETGRDVASRVGSSAGEGASSLFHRSSRALGFERRHSSSAGKLAAGGIGAVGALALGAGMMWLFDPDRGRSRRAWLGQKVPSVVRDVGHMARSAGVDLANRGKGLYYQTAGAVRSRGSRHGMDVGASDYGNEMPPSAPGVESMAHTPGGQGTSPAVAGSSGTIMPEQTSTGS
ncbi:MAG: hypothetical protein ACREIT_03095 [Tepidisphaeraceae bacterium]